MERTASCTRKTKETDIMITFNLDGTGKTDIDTGVGFLNHMLDGFAKHGLFDLTVKVKGDLEVDCHHTIEDTGIVLGQAIMEAIGDKVGIRRYGHFILPMDETLALFAVDLSGRPYLRFDSEFTVDCIGDMDTEMIKEFLKNEKLTCAVLLYKDKDTYLEKVKNAALNFDESKENSLDRKQYVTDALLRMSM